MTDRDLVDEIVAAWTTQLPEAAGLHLELAKRVTRLAGLFDGVIEPVLDAHGLTKVEYGVLATLRAAGDPFRLKPSELSGSLVVTTGGLSNVLLRLADAELVTREPDPHDRRSSWVRLTPAGVKLAEAIVRDVAAAQKRLLEPLPEATGRAVADLLREVLITLDGPHRPRNPRRHRH